MVVNSLLVYICNVYGVAKLKLLQKFSLNVLFYIKRVFDLESNINIIK